MKWNCAKTTQPPRSGLYLTSLQMTENSEWSFLGLTNFEKKPRKSVWNTRHFVAYWADAPEPMHRKRLKDEDDVLHRMKEHLWRPQEGEPFYWVNGSGQIAWEQNLYPCNRTSVLCGVGNCYQTAEEIELEMIVHWTEWLRGGKHPTRKE